MQLLRIIVELIIQIKNSQRMQETTNHSQAGKSSSSSGFAKTALRLGDSSSGANMTSFNQAAQRKPLVITPTNVSRGPICMRVCSTTSGGALSLVSFLVLQMR